MCMHAYKGFHTKKIITNIRIKSKLITKQSLTDYINILKDKKNLIKCSYSKILLNLNTNDIFS
jgi:hypothetical protein